MAGLQGIIAFSETAKHGGFARAARELGLSASAVAKSVARLESDLGLRLLQRTTRKVSLTSDGRGLYERCQRIVQEMEALRADAEGVRGEPSGTLRLNMPLSYGRKVIVPVLAVLARRHPRLRFDLGFSDRFVDVHSEGLDAVIRIGQLSDSSLVARSIGEQQLVVLASPRYLKARGTPRSPAELETHDCMVFRLPTSGRSRAWEFRETQGSIGRPVEMTPAARFALDDGEALVSAAAEGLGLVQVPSYMAEELLERRGLVEVMARWRPEPMPVSLLHASGRQVTPRLRVLIDALIEPSSTGGRKAARRG